MSASGCFDVLEAEGRANGRFWTGKLAKTIKMDTRPSTICHYEIIFDFEHISLETMSNMFLYDFGNRKKVPF